MPERRKSARVSRIAKPDPATENVFKRLDCLSIRYDLNVPIRIFNAKKFSEITGITRDKRWHAILKPKRADTGYHVHFDGIITAKHVKMTVEYWDKGKKAKPNEPEPFAESVMQWIGSFIREPSMRVAINVRFEKHTDSWRSRFNLPFKVNMAGKEVAIEGIALQLPSNPYRALSSFMATDDDRLYIYLFALRAVEFRSFDIDAEVASFNEAIKIFSEPVL
jgi:hypothetical protein